MKDLNLTVLTGRLVKDPVLHTNGSKSAYFRIASNRSYRDKNDSWQQENAFLSCIAYGYRAEALANRKKGEMVLAEGRLKTEHWQSDAGTVRSELILVVDSLRFITCEPGPKTTSGSSAEPEGGQEAPPSTNDVPF